MVLMKVWILRGVFKVLLVVILETCDLPGDLDFSLTPDDLVEGFLTLLFMLAGPLELSLALCCYLDI